MSFQKWWKSIAYLTVLVVSGILFNQCVLGGSSGFHSGGGLFLQGSASYVLKGNTIIKTEIRTYHDCDSNMHPVVFTDTFVDTESYELLGNTFSNTYDDSVFLYDSISGNFATQAHALVRHKQDYTRVGAGSDLVGTWKYTGESYRVLSGALTTSEKAEMDQEVQYFSKRDTYYETDQIQITATQFLSYRDFQWGRYYMDEWNGVAFGEPVPDSMKILVGVGSAIYNISQVMVDLYTVQLTGGVTHEVVTLRRSNDYSEDYTSSIPTHKSRHIPGMNEIRDCSYDPADTTYDWIDNFYNHNVKPGILVKTTALAKQGLFRMPTTLNRERSRRTPFLFRHFQ